MLLHSSIFLAQTYGCGVGNKGCQQSPQGSTGQNPQESSGMTQNNPKDQTQLQQAATFEQSKEFLGPVSVSGQSASQPMQQSQYIGTIFDLLIIGVVIGAIAVFILLIKRYNRQLTYEENDLKPEKPSTSSEEV